MADTSLLGSFENLWHYGHLLITSLPTSSLATIPPPLTNSASICPKISSLHSLFSVMDEDSDGQLSLFEMRSLLAKLHIGSDQSLDFIEHISTGTGDDGFSLDFPQFAQLYTSLFGASHDSASHEDSGAQCETDDCSNDELLDAFRVYDTNHDGFITAAELAAVLLELGLLPADHGVNAHLGRCQAHIDRVDLDGNGMVDLHEFTSMMKHHNLLTLGFHSSFF